MTVRKLRLDQGLSQDQLALMAGISTRTLQRIERGAQASPETLKCLAAALDTDFPTLRDAPASGPQSQPALTVDGGAARSHIRDLRAFRLHALQYGVVMAGLLALNLFTNPGNLWVIWPALCWGLGVAAHGLSICAIPRLTGPGWQSRRTARQLAAKMGRGR